MSTTIELRKTGRKVFLPKLEIEIKGKTSMLGMIDQLVCSTDELSLIEPLFPMKNALIPAYNGYLEQCTIQVTDGELEEKELYLIQAVCKDPLSGAEIKSESAAYLSQDQQSINDTIAKLTKGAEVSVTYPETADQQPEPPIRKNEPHTRDTFLVDASLRGNKIKLQDLKSLETFSNVIFILQKRLAETNRKNALESCRAISVPKNLMAVVREELQV